VNVPGDFVENSLEHVDRDESHGALDQASREQAGLSEAILPVTLADGIRLLPQLKGLARLR